MTVENAIDNLTYVLDNLSIERGSDFSGVNALKFVIDFLENHNNHAGVLLYEGETYVNDEPILKTKDKNGMCSFYGFKKVEVEDDSKTSEETTK